MAGELMVINPRRRRGRRKKARSSHRRTRVRRRRRAAAVNPRRRVRRHRRAHARRSHRRRRTHSNPRLGLGSLTSGLKDGLGIGIGVVATEVGVGAAIKFIPGIPPQLQTGLGKSALKIAVGGLVLPFVLKKVGQGKLARNVAIGAWVSVAVDLLTTYVTPHLGLSEYTAGSLGVYSAGTLMAGYPDNQLNPDEVGAAENMYGDTMYGY